eukprot:GSChrysophyteH1.ASY1.ANO1.1840.1 assembled CDS
MWSFRNFTTFATLQKHASILIWAFAPCSPPRSQLYNPAAFASL